MAGNWYVRAFVAAAHRRSRVAVSLAVIGRQHLVQRHVSGQDQRGIGLMYEVEHDGLKRHFPLALWLRADFLFVGGSRGGITFACTTSRSDRPEPPRPGGTCGARITSVSWRGDAQAAEPRAFTTSP